MQLVDKYGRKIDYVRLAITDRCNLRCFYCMPEQGIDWLQRSELLTYAEMLRLCGILARMGVTKVRITGGEPFARKDLMPFLASLAAIDGIDTLTLTTNGVLTRPYVSELHKLGIKSINISLDTLDRDRFLAITRRDELQQVLDTINECLRVGIQVKINAVVMDGRNIDDILPLVQLASSQPIDVRFIEEMPFNGGEAHYENLKWDHQAILNHIKIEYPNILALPPQPHATASIYQIPGFKGNVGIIAAYTRSFCGTCNRLRITPQGIIKTCLYEGGGLDIKELMRSNTNDPMLMQYIANAVSNKAKDGRVAESLSQQMGIHSSMATIGG